MLDLNLKHVLMSFTMSHQQVNSQEGKKSALVCVQEI